MHTRACWGVSGPAMKCWVPATPCACPMQADTHPPVRIQSASDADLFSAKIFASVWAGPKAKAQLKALGESIFLILST